MATITRKQQASRAERRAAIEASLLAATGRLMAAGESFTEVSVERLAVEAGISRPTFYVYFEDKGDLLRRLGEKIFAELADPARSWWEVADRYDRDKVFAAMSGMVAAHRRHRVLIAAIVEMAAYDEGVGTRYRQLFDIGIENLAAVIKRGVDAGTVRAVHPRETASALTWLTERYIYQSFSTPRPPDEDDIARTLTDIICATLYDVPQETPGTD